MKRMKRISAVFLTTALILFGNVLARASNRTGFKGYKWGTSLKTIKSSEAISEAPPDSKWLKYIRMVPADAMSLQEFLGVEKVLFERDEIYTEYRGIGETHECTAIYGFIDDKLAVGAYMRLTANEEDFSDCPILYGYIQATLQKVYGEEDKIFGGRGRSRAFRDVGSIWYTKRTMILLYQDTNSFLEVFPGYREFVFGIDKGYYPICWALVYRDRSQLKATRAIRKKPTERVERIRAQKAKEAEEGALDKL